MSTTTRTVGGVALTICLVAFGIQGARAGDDTSVIRTVEAADDRVVVQLEAVTTHRAIDEAGLVTVRVPGYGQIREIDRPVLPRMTTLVALPTGTEPVLTVDVASWSRTGIADLSTWRPESPEPDWIVSPAIDPSSPWPPEPARIAWTGRIRGRSVALLELFPVRYLADEHVTERASGITVRVDFAALTEDATSESMTTTISGPGDLFGSVDDLVVNPGQLANASDSIFAPRTSVTPIASQGSTDGTAIAAVKVEVTTSGIHAFTGADLQAIGIDLTGVDPRELTVRNNGASVPILVEGEDDGVFGASDTVVFYGERIDNRFTGTNVYWLETDAVNALRMTTRDATPAGAQLATTYRDFERREESLLYTGNSPPAQSTEHWWWERLDTPAGTYPSQSDVYRLTLGNLPATASNARLRFNVQGRSRQFPQPDHRTLLFVNGTQVDDQTWFDIESFTHDVLVDPSLLVEGENIITLEQRQQPNVAFASLYSNWFSLEYDDTFTAESDNLLFDMDPATFTVELDGFSDSAVQVFDVTDPANPVLLTGVVVETSVAGWLARFQDSPAAAASYAATGATAGRLAPAALVEDIPSSLGSTANGADLIIVTDRAFAEEIQPLVDRRVAEGLRTAVGYVDDVMDEFADGVFTPEAIRDFLQFAYTSWQPPAPTFVLLFGDGTLDYRDFLGNGGNVVPVLLTPNLPGIGEVMTDNAFVRVDGGDLVPDMYVARYTIRTEAQAQAAVDKIVEYAQNPPAATVGDNVTLVADDGLNSFNADFEDISDALAAIVPDTMGSVKIYASQYATGNDMRNDISVSINAGTLITNYLGHGNETIWGAVLGSNNFYDSGAVTGLTNGADLTFTMALNCVNGYFANLSRPYSMGEEWLRISTNGGIGGYTPSGLGFLGDYDVLNREIFRRIFVEHDTRIGSFAVQSLIRAYVEFGIPGENMDELILLGDPSAHLASDADRDTLLDREEVEAGSDPGDADGDDDGLGDADEPSWNTDPDGDGRVNAADFDSDDDGLPDGLESGLTTPSPATDTSLGRFVADTDPATTTSMQVADTDGGGAPDGAEDRNVNGAVDNGETDPNNGADDPACSATTPAEIDALLVNRDGADVVVSWADQVPSDACLLYRVYVATGPTAPATEDRFVYEATVTGPEFRHAGVAIDGVTYWYLVTAISPIPGEGPLGHYGR